MASLGTSNGWLALAMAKGRQQEIEVERMSSLNDSASTCSEKPWWSRQIQSIGHSVLESLGLEATGRTTTPVRLLSACSGICSEAFALKDWDVAWPRYVDVC